MIRVDVDLFGLGLQLLFGVERFVWRQRRRAAQVNGVGRAAFAEPDRILEVTADGNLLFRGGGGHQPHHQKERHHRRGKVGEGDFPGTTVMT